MNNRNGFTILQVIVFTVVITLSALMFMKWNAAYLKAVGNLDQKTQLLTADKALTMYWDCCATYKNYFGTAYPGNIPLNDTMFTTPVPLMDRAYNNINILTKPWEVQGIPGGSSLLVQYHERRIDRKYIERDVSGFQTRSQVSSQADRRGCDYDHDYCSGGSSASSTSTSTTTSTSTATATSTSTSTVTSTSTALTSTSTVATPTSSSTATATSTSGFRPDGRQCAAGTPIGDSCASTVCPPGFHCVTAPTCVNFHGGICACPDGTACAPDCQPPQINCLIACPDHTECGCVQTGPGCNFTCGCPCTGMPDPKPSGCWTTTMPGTDTNPAGTSTSSATSTSSVTSTSTVSPTTSSSSTTSSPTTQALPNETQAEATSTSTSPSSSTTSTTSTPSVQSPNQTTFPNSVD